MKTAKITFTFDDASELYHIINNRGFCSTRAKLLIALRELDGDLAKRIDASDVANLNTMAANTAQH